MRSDGERDRWEIAAPAAAKSAAARRPGGPARPLQKGACPHNDLAPRVRGQSKQWLTDWHRKLVVLQVNSNALWAIWPRFLIRDSAQNGARRLTDGPYGMRKPHPPCPSHRQALSRLDNARRTGCSREIPAGYQIEIRPTPSSFQKARYLKCRRRRGKFWRLRRHDLRLKK